MPKISDEPLEAIQLRLFKADLDYLRKMFRGHVGVNKALRTIVRSFVTQSKAGADEAINKIESEAQGEATS